MIHRIGRHAAVAMAAALLAVPAEAQTYRSAFGLSGGWATYGDLTPGLEETTQLEPGWLAGAQLEAWPGSGRFGVRLNGAFTVRAVDGVPDPTYNVYSADLDLLVRPLRAGRSRWVAPFVALGAGASHFDAGASDEPLGGGAYGEDPVTRVHALVGAGLDLLPSHRFGLRLEAGDQIVLASVGQSPPSEGFPQVHNVRFQAGVQLRMGELEGRPVYARRPPAPAPVRTAAPARAAPAPTPSAPLGEPAPAAAPAPATPAAPVVEAEEVTRLERRLERQGEEYARELTRLERRVTALEEARERPALAAAPSPAPAAPPAAPARASTDRLYTVQWGAFIDVDTALDWQERLERRELPVWLEDYRHQGRMVKRVRVGALTSRAEAERLGRRLEREYGWSVWVVALSRDAQVPAHAVGSTVAFLGGR